MQAHGCYESSGKGRIYYRAWIPEGKPRAVVQVVRTILAWSLLLNESNREEIFADILK